LPARPVVDVLAAGERDGHWQAWHPAGGVGLGVITLAWLGWQMVSFRSSAGERRQQLKLLFGVAVAIVCSIIYQALNSLPGAWGTVGRIIGYGTNALPVSVGVAILKYRLYDIDPIISRTLAYAIVTGTLVGVYAGLVLLATQVLAVRSPVGHPVTSCAPGSARHRGGP
jgi:hypothetical protein